MAFGITGKIIIGTAVTALAVTGSVGIHFINNPKNMEEKFRKSGVDLLEEESEKWTELVSKYKSITQDDSGSTIKIEGLSLQDPENAHKKALQDKCKELLKTELNDSNYEQREKEAMHWCVKNPKALP